MLTETNETIDFQEWASNLDLQRTRALASQAGIVGWGTLSLSQLRNKLIGNDSAYRVYRLNFYGEV